jgi:sugar phosphate isomerase/epimerase
MARIPIGLQLYSVRDDCKKDLPGTLKAVAEMGYDGVEFAGYYDYTAKQLRKMLDDVGLVCCGTHIGLATLLGDELPKTIEFNRELGNRFLICPGLPEERRNSRAAWRETAQLFNQIAEQLEGTGMLTGYHNHWVEFSPMDGELPWDTFFGNTRADIVMQIDTGNAMHGGADPIPFLVRYPGRAITVHLKEYSKGRGQGYDAATIGEGDVRWAEFFELCETTGKTEWYIVEQENYDKPPLECVELCLKALKKMGK